MVVVSEDDEGGGVTTGAGGGTVPYSVVVVVSLVPVGPHAEQKPTANAAIDMVAHDLQLRIFVNLPKNIAEPCNLIGLKRSYREGTFAPTCALRIDQ